MTKWICTVTENPSVGYSAARVIQIKSMKDWKKEKTRIAFWECQLVFIEKIAVMRIVVVFYATNIFVYFSTGTWNQRMF